MTIMNPNIFRIVLKELESDLIFHDYTIGTVKQGDENIVFPRQIWVKLNFHFNQTHSVKTIDVVNAAFILTQDVLHIAELFGEDMLRGFFEITFDGRATVSVFGLPGIPVSFETKQKIAPIPIVVQQIGT
jgi:hypothetical protein